MWAILLAFSLWGAVTRQCAYGYFVHCGCSHKTVCVNHSWERTAEAQLNHGPSVYGNQPSSASREWDVYNLGGALSLDCHLGARWNAGFDSVLTHHMHKHRFDTPHAQTVLTHHMRKHRFDAPHAQTLFWHTTCTNTVLWLNFQAYRRGAECLLKLRECSSIFLQVYGLALASPVRIIFKSMPEGKGSLLQRLRRTDALPLNYMQLGSVLKQLANCLLDLVGNAFI